MAKCQENREIYLPENGSLAFKDRFRSLSRCQICSKIHQPGISTMKSLRLKFAKPPQFNSKKSKNKAEDSLGYNKVKKIKVKYALMKSRNLSKKKFK